MLSNVIAALAVVAALGSAGCEATFTPANPSVAIYGRFLAPAEVVPTDVWAYPHVYYGGSYVYLVDGLWYTPTSRGWMVYRREPVELSRERSRIYAAQPYEYNPRIYVNPRANPRIYVNPRANPRIPPYGYPPQPPVEYNRERNAAPPY